MAHPWDLLPGAVVELDLDANATACNSAFSALLRLGATPAHDRGWLDGVPEGPRHALERALAERADFALPLQWQRGGGDWLHAEVHAHWLAPRGRYLALLHDVTALREAEVEARAQAQQLRLLADNLPALIAYYEVEDFRCLFANRHYAQAFGFDTESVVGRTVREIIGEAAAREIQPRIDEALQRRLPVQYERRTDGRDGRERWLEVHLLPHLGDDGEPFACFVLIHDITRHRQAEAAARESEERLSAFMEASVEGILFHKDGQITDVNPALLELTGYCLKELPGRHVLNFIAPEDVGKVLSVMGRGLETAYEVQLLHRNGQRIPVELIVRSMTRNGERLRMVIVRDLRDRLEAQARIRHLAHHDALTGLANRNAFLEQMEHLIAAAAASGESLALLFVDLDHFKRVNDSLGHLAGDRLLQAVATRLRGALRGSDLVARFGGDEFMVLLRHAGRREDIEEVARKLLQAVATAVEVEGQRVSVTPSIGIAVCPGDAGTVAELIQRADAAMYAAKAAGRAGYRFFEPLLGAPAPAAPAPDAELAQGLERAEFELHWQPQVRAGDGVVTAMAALLRWRHPQRGLLAPDAFLAVAAQRPLGRSLGDWALREALRAARAWREQGRAAVVAIEMHCMAWRSPGFAERVQQLLAQAEVPAAQLEFELSERLLMEDATDVPGLLARLKALGVRLTLDDFGAGCSSLAQLKDLPLDRLKVDRALVRDLPHDPRAAAVLRAIVQLAGDLGLEVVAAGVQTEAQRRALAQLGCDLVQGDAVAAPQPLAQAQHWLQRARPTLSAS